MPSILYSTTCYIKDDFYRLRIFVDDSNDYSELITNENIRSENDSLELSATSIPIKHIIPSSTRLNFQLLNESKINTNFPETIILNHLLTVQQTTPLPKRFSKKLTQSLQTPSLEGSNRSVNPLTDASTLEQSGQISYITFSTNESPVLFKRRQFSFRKFFSLPSNTDSETILLFKTLIKIKYIDVSNSTQWRIKCLELEMDTESIADELYSNLNLCLSTLRHRPRRLLAFVNPLSGKGRAQSVFDKKVLPIFQEANVIVDTINTQHANHAQEYVINESIDDYDGLVCVGGDGMFAELCHGLLLRTVRNEQLDIDNPRVNITRPNMRIGIIPAGSTDAVVFGTTGLNDPTTSALQIIIGESLFIDIATVHNENGFVRFMATMLAYGFFGDIIHQSDRWRALGPLRYDLAGFCQFLRHTSYSSELTITLSSEDSSKVCQPQTTTTAPINNVDRSLTGSGYRQLVNDSSSTLSEINPINRPLNREKRSNSSNSVFCRRNCERCAEEKDIIRDDNKSPLKLKLEGRYTTINCLNMPCRCAKSKFGMSPFVHLGDGTFDLILVKRSWRASFLRFLWQVANDGRSIEDLSNVERYRVQEVLIRPIRKGKNQTGNWACDGELIYGNEIQVRVHRQALNLFASGIQLKEKPINISNNNETIRCCNCFKFNKGKTSQESNS